MIEEIYDVYEGKPFLKETVVKMTGKLKMACIGGGHFGLFQILGHG